ncbi:MAG: UDP-N-acetylmuramoyl-tripeptide--D-alanyl-D-alanine ligase [Candidatus Pacebacteria bacterium]|nr:UDP-N-acetylmuramoyl-tripeptide--D-alanyl-D-alanine ligase [Candidatus Paceibacterota bacterium]
MKSLIQKLLKILTRRVLLKQQPNIITITGSVGKTSTKEGIYFAIKNLGDVRRSLKNYNNELGVPFTVALWNGKAPGKNIISWKLVFLRLIYFSIFKSKKYPKWLVLEIGSDKPGDLQYLMEMIPIGFLKGAVLTAIFGVHLEFFKTIEAIYQEKTTPFKYIANDGFVLVNSDNCDIERIKKDFPDKKIISYGFEKQSDITAFDFRAGESGLNFKIKTPEGDFEFLLKQAISAYQCYPILAGVGVALNLGVNVNEALKNLSEKEPMPGRMRLIKGTNDSLIIDDTYNSSPEAAKYALKALKELPRIGRKIAVLGDMLELGPDSQKFHKEIEDFAKNLGIDVVITFGKEKQFTDHQQVSDYLKNLIKPNDTILIKGSQGVRMEKIVKQIMLRPDQAKDLLVRQGGEWV